jgi:hypothetical protein
MSGPLSGLVVSLSGYQNPERGNMRDAACSLGADYCPDFNERYLADEEPLPLLIFSPHSWNSWIFLFFLGCRVSHLVCAFVGNTPKIESAKRAKATIVMGDWLTECKAKGKRLPVGNVSSLFLPLFFSLSLSLSPSLPLFPSPYL